MAKNNFRSVEFRRRGIELKISKMFHFPRIFNQSFLNKHFISFEGNKCLKFRTLRKSRISRKRLVIDESFDLFWMQHTTLDNMSNVYDDITIVTAWSMRKS